MLLGTRLDTIEDLDVFGERYCHFVKGLELFEEVDVGGEPPWRITKGRLVEAYCPTVVVPPEISGKLCGRIVEVMMDTLLEANDGAVDGFIVKQLGIAEVID